MQRVNSWMQTNDPADPLSFLLEEAEGGRQADPLDGSFIGPDYHRSVSEDEIETGDGPSVRVPLKTANSAKK